MPTGRLLVVEKGDAALGVVDLESGRRIGGVRASGIAPHEVVASADGTLAFLPVYGDGGVGEPGTDGRAVDVIDLRALDDASSARSIDLGGPARPHDAALGVDGRIHVTTETRRALSILDADTLEVVGSIDTGRDQSHMVALSSDGRFAYTANVEPGSVSVLDLRADALVRVVELGTRINRISIAPDDGTVFVADQDAPRLGMLDTGDLSLRWVGLPAVGYSTVPTADGARLLIGFRATSQVGILDVAGGVVTRLVDVPPTPQRIVIPPTGSGAGVFAYVSCDRADVVVELDVDAGRVRREFRVGGGPDGLAWSPVPPAPPSA